MTMTSQEIIDLNNKYLCSTYARFPVAFVRGEGCRLWDAEALQAEKFILLTDVSGINDKDGNLMPTVSATQAQELIDDGTISEGMIPKVECCISALHGGAHKTHILDGRVRHSVLLEILTKEGIGTEVSRLPV